MQRLAAPFVFVLAFGSPIARAVEDRPPISLWGRLEKGAYTPGFRTIEIVDESRKSHGKPRPIQISLWYPARASLGAATMTYEDYARITAREAGPATPDDEAGAISSYREFLHGNGIELMAVDAWLRASMGAVMNATPAQGRFPVALIAQGMGGAVTDQALLGEYLATHGWVVATSPSQARLGDDAEGLNGLFRSAHQQARDLDVIWQRLRTFPLADIRRTAAIGYSFGARSALLFAGRHPSARALVSIDGGIGNRSGRDWLKGRSRVETVALRTPVLHFFEDTDETVTPDFSLIAAMKRSNRLLLKVANMRHLHFITFGMATALVPGVGPGPKPNRDIEASFGAVLRYTRAFLEAHVEGSQEDRVFLGRDPAANGFGGALPTAIRMTPQQ